jgi:hypothetical protein
VVLRREDNTTPFQWSTQSSRRSIRGTMVSFAWLHSKPPKEHLYVL